MDVDSRHPRLTLASMGVNTNDMFAAINGECIVDGRVFLLEPLDAGSEANTELCSEIPGPACRDMNPNNANPSQGAEGFVHVHPGVSGFKGDLDFENNFNGPVLRVTISRRPFEGLEVFV